MIIAFANIAAAQKRFRDSGVIQASFRSVLVKSSPVQSKGRIVTFAMAYVRQSPKFSAAG